MSRSCGQLSDDERDQALYILGYSFPDLDAIADVLQRTPAERTFAVRKDSRLVSIVLWRVERVIAFGRAVPIAIAGPGATHPDYRGHGVLAACQPAFLAAMRDAGCVVSGLETPITRWHRRNGWGVGSAVARYVAGPDQFRPGIPGAGALLAPGPVDALPDLYARAAALRFGFLHRIHARWQELMAADSRVLRRDCVTWQDADGRCSGYVRYSHRQSRNGPELELDVEELVALTLYAYTGLLGFLAAHYNVATIRWDAPTDDPLSTLFREPRAVEPRLCVDKMVRVVDVASLEFPAAPQSTEPEGLVIVIDDAQAPWNAHAWRVERSSAERFAMTPAQCSATRPAGWCRIDAPVLGPLVTRYLPVDAAARCGLIEVPGEDTLSRLRALFGSGPAPYCPDTW